MSAAKLTDRERQVCDLVAEGLTNSQIGERLHVSISTVKTHLARIFRKTGAVGRAQLVTAGAAKVRTSAEVVEILRSLRRDRVAFIHPVFSPDSYRQEGELLVLDKLIEQIGAGGPSEPAEHDRLVIAQAFARGGAR